MLTTTQLPAEGRATTSHNEHIKTPLSPEPASEKHLHAGSELSKGSKPGHEEIAELAYSYWLSRQGSDGSAEEDWLRAERELGMKTAEEANA